MATRILLVLGVLLIVGGIGGYLYQHRPVPVKAPLLPPPPKKGRRPTPQEAGWKEIPLRCEGGRCRVPFVIKALPRCFFGDFDLIEMERKAGATPLALSFESLDTGHANVASPSVPLPDGIVSKGEFIVPQTERPVMMGVFLCSDSTHVGSCRNKPVQDYHAVLAQFAEAPNHRASDKNYYFEPAVLERDKLYVPDAEDDIARRMTVWAARAAFLDEPPQTGNAPTTGQQAVAAAYHDEAALHSLTAAPENGGFVIALPKQRSGCPESTEKYVPPKSAKPH